MGDTVIITIHRLSSKELYIHHLIFAAVAYIVIGHCICPLTCAVLLAQELSTPALSIFLLLRAFVGMKRMVTMLTFVVFAIQFYAIRVGLNTVNTVRFALEVIKGTNGPSGFDTSQPVRY